MTWWEITLTAAIAILFVAALGYIIYKKLTGKSSCDCCDGNCHNCPHCKSKEKNNGNK